MNNDHLKVLKAFGMDKRAASILGIGPAEGSKSATMTKTTMPMSGAEAESSLSGYTHRPTPKTTSAAANELDAKDKSKEPPTEKKVEKLESASDTPPKKAPEKKPEKESENEVEYKQAVLRKLALSLDPIPGKRMGERALYGGLGGAAIGGVAPPLKALLTGEEMPKNQLRNVLLGGGAGALTGAMTAENAPNIREILRTMLTAGATGAGAVGGLYGGGRLGGLLAERLSPGGAFDAKAQRRRALIQLVSMLVGGFGGGALGYSLTRDRSEKKGSAQPPFRKESVDFDLPEERKGMSTTTKILLGALAGAGIPVAVWHGSHPLIRKLIKRIHDWAPLEKLHHLPTTHPRATKALMYSPAAIGGLVGGLSGGDEDEFKLSNTGEATVKQARQDRRAMPDMRRMSADQPPQDVIPLLGPLGGKVLGGLGSITGGLGMPGVSEKLQGWSKDPTARSIAGGGTAALATLLAILAARKLMGESNEEKYLR